MAEIKLHPVDTPLKTNMEPKKWRFGRWFSFSTRWFSVSFRESTWYLISTWSFAYVSSGLRCRVYTNSRWKHDFFLPPSTSSTENLATASEGPSWEECACIVPFLLLSKGRHDAQKICSTLLKHWYHGSNSTRNWRRIFFELPNMITYIHPLIYIYIS